MVFSSEIFLFAFLPLVLIAALVANRRGQNVVLLVASLFFYAWGEVGWAWVLLASLTFNYAAGRIIGRARRSRPTLVLAIVVNLGLLAWFKYAGFASDSVNFALAPLGVRLRCPEVHLPIGISFFTFHALSYLIDVSRERAEPATDPVDFALYMTFFPQLIAGPIVRYHDIAHQLPAHRISLSDAAAGIRRFVLGLGKKVLVANTVATSVDALYALPKSDLTPTLAWMGALLYALQIYFDFSGYSDMAIGLARFFGLQFPENFDYPYVAQSVTEFWRRWHLSLSTWFRDYLYVPLGGNRGGRVRTYRNLVVVFFLCGLWHGASWTFVSWGRFHGTFLVLERAGLSRLLSKLPRPLRHAYLLLVVTLGWVLFRADSFSIAWLHLSALFSATTPVAVSEQAMHYPTNDVLAAAIVGVLGSAPILPWLSQHRAALASAADRTSRALSLAWETAALVSILLVFATSAAVLASGSYDPFIYFRF